MKQQLIHKENHIPVEVLCTRCKQFPKKPVKCLNYKCQVIQCYKCAQKDKPENRCLFKCSETLQIGILNQFEQFYFEIQLIICEVCKNKIKGLDLQKHKKYCKLKLKFQSEGCEIKYCSNCQKQQGFKCKYCQSFLCFQCKCQCGLFFPSLIQNEDYLLEQKAVNCIYCSQNLIYNDLADHIQVCAFTKVKCEYCGFKNKRNKMQSHILRCLKKQKQQAEIEKQQLKMVGKLVLMQLEQQNSEMSVFHTQIRKFNQQFNDFMNDNGVD